MHGLLSIAALPSRGWRGPLFRRGPRQPFRVLGFPRGFLWFALGGMSASLSS